MLISPSTTLFTNLDYDLIYINELKLFDINVLSGNSFPACFKTCLIFFFFFFFFFFVIDV